MSRSTSNPPRRVTFEYPPDMEPVWTPDRTEFACAANSVSLMMPTIEPYFVRSARKALPALSGALAERTASYIVQEAQHHGQHLRFNRMLKSHYPVLARLERLMTLVYGRLESLGTARFNLGFAAASETMAYSAARWAAQHRIELFGNAHDVPATLFLWHLAEEVEHKSVAFDIYWRLFNHRLGSRLVYGLAMALALVLMIFFVVGGTTLMLVAERRFLNPRSWFRLIRWATGFAFELLSNLIVSLLPGHHPSNFTDPLWYEVWLREFDLESGSLPVWHALDESADGHRAGR